MSTAELPQLFGLVPTGLFGPLASGQSPLYWEILVRLYQHEFEREPFIVVRPLAAEIAEEVLRTSRIWLERREEIIADETLVEP